jgi:hypothetical protein
MLLLSQQMLQHVEFTSTESHLLCMLMFHKTTRITSTARAAQPVPVNLVLL